MAYDWRQLGVQEITNLYLYGQVNTPNDLASDAWIRPDSPKAIEVNMATFMATGPGRFALGPASDLVSAFMTGATFVESGSKGSASHIFLRSSHASSPTH